MSDEDMIDWDALLAEGTETNEANVDSVATLDRDHDDTVTYDWDDDPSVFAEHLKAVMDKCETDGFGTSSAAAAEHRSCLRGGRASRAARTAAPAVRSSRSHKRAL